MIYFCADDYGLNAAASMHIRQCVEQGALNKVSVFPNFEQVDLSEILKNKKVRLSLHINLVEGKCMADAGKIGLIAEKNGNLKHTFGGLLKLSLFHPKKLEAQVYEEIKAQVMHWKRLLPEDVPFCIDSHQHTHMIPAVFKALIKVLRDGNIKTEYLRIPAEPLMPYIKKPSLYFTYSPVNVIKQWLLRFLWFVNKKQVKNNEFPTSLFMGILFSGKMDARVSKILPEYVKLAEKKGTDAEILFHPGYLENADNGFKEKNVVFEKFYCSGNRKTEFDSVLKLTEGSVT